MKSCVFTSLLLLLFITSGYAQILEHSEGDLMEFEPSNLDVLSANLPTRGTQTLLEAGDLIEGDYLQEIKFNPTGDEFWILNRATNNISVFDWESQNIVATIEVGASPTDFAFSDEVAVVACLASNEVYFIDWETYEILAVQTVGSQPAKVVVSRDSEIAVVGSDEVDEAAVFTLDDFGLKFTIPNFPVYISKFAFITSNPRNALYWSGFQISPDNQYLYNAAGEDGLLIFNLDDGSLVATIPELSDCAQVQLSGDGNFLILVRTGSDGVVYKWDIETGILTSETTLTGYSIWSTNSPPAVNFDGSKVFVSCNPENTALVDTDNNTFQTIETGNSPDWVGQSADYEYAIASDYYQAVISFETGEIESSFSGISINSGAVSPANNRIVATDPLRYELVHLFDFENINTYNWIGTQASGSELEGDATYSVTFSPDGKYLAAMNALSGTMSLFDVEMEELVKIIPLGSTETYQVDFTSDSQYALVAKRLENLVAIIDMETLEVVTEVSSGGSKPDQVYVLPGDEYAYAVNAGSPDRIGVIALNGANSSLQSTFNVGNMGISWMNYGIRSDLKFDHTGEYAFLAAPFDETVNIIDINAHTVIGSMPIEGFPLQIAIGGQTSLGEFSAVTLRNSDAIAIINGSGPTAIIVDAFSFGEAPTRIAYDPLNEGFVVLSNTDQSMQTYSLEALDFVDQVIYNDHTPIAVKVSNDGRKFVLLRSNDTDDAPHYFEIDGELYELPALPIQHIDVNPEGTLAAVAFPGTDQVMLFKEEVSSSSFKAELMGSAESYILMGNPIGAEIHLRASNGGFKEAVNFSIYDVNGRLMLQQEVAPGADIQIDRPDEWSPAIYYYQFQQGGKILEAGEMLVH